MTLDPPRTALDCLVRPHSVAIVGASSDPTKTAGRPLHYLRRHGFAGRILPVNPRYSELDGLPCSPDASVLPETPDVALVLLPAEPAIAAVRALAERGTPAAIVLAGGFAEIGGDGPRRQAELRQAAGSMRLLGPNTLGLINLTERAMLSASVALDLPSLPAGKVAMVSQSGGMLGALLSRGVDNGIGFSRLVATGNEADLDICDVLDYLLEDDATSVVGLYLESIRRPANFRSLAQQARARGKPLVVLKVGRSEAGAQSATSHTGALAGADRVYDALFQQAGAIRVDTLSDLVDVAGALAAPRPLPRRRLAVLTSTGGGATLVADAAGLHGFTLPPPDPPTQERLATTLVGEGSLPDRNPVDLTLAGIKPEVYREAIRALLDSPTYDALVVVIGSSGIGQPELAARPIVEAAAATDKPLFVYVNPRALNIVRHLNQRGVPAFDRAEGCAAALAALARVSSPRDVDIIPTLSIQAPPRAQLSAGSLNEAESKALFARFGIPPVAEWAVATPEEAAERASVLDAPVVLKVLSRDLAHKSEVGGVRIGVMPQDVQRACLELRGAVDRARPNIHIEGWLVQEQVPDATELLLGMVRDPQLGPAIVLGAGGVATEVFDDIALRLPPLRRADAEEMLAALRARRLLEGFRGRPRGDIPALLEAVLAFSACVEAMGDTLLEAEINPLFVLPEAHGVRAADGLVVFRGRAPEALGISL